MGKGNFNGRHLSDYDKDMTDDQIRQLGNFYAAKCWGVETPGGKRLNVTNLYGFCRDHNLSYKTMANKYASGTCKGYRVFRRPK